MHITLTDHLTCPRCGPTAGLILLMEAAEERRVVTGALGCPVCRTRYPVAGRVADLRDGAEEWTDADAGAGTPQAPAAVAEAALRVAALLELAEPGGIVLLDGPAALDVAEGLRPYAPDVELAVVIDGARAEGARRLEASALLTSEALPVADRVMRGAAYAGGTPGASRLRELLRVVRPTGRLVIETMGSAGDLESAAQAVIAEGGALRARDATGLLAVVF